jgi:uncharacterized membrane protein (DUF485 family)
MMTKTDWLSWADGFLWGVVAALLTVKLVGFDVAWWAVLSPFAVMAVAWVYAAVLVIRTAKLLMRLKASD